MVSLATYNDVLSYFNFWPSRDLAIVALSLYIAAAMGVLAMTIKTRAWYMLVAVGVGLMAMAGYACRISMTSKPLYGVYVAMQCLLIIPPSFLALVQYITIGKVVSAVQRSQPEAPLPIKSKQVTWIFFALEIGSLALQGAGAGLSVSNNGPTPNASAGKALLMTGLALLVALMISFIITAVYVNFSAIYGVRKSPAMRWLFTALYSSTLLLLVRNIFRLVEFSGGWYSYLALHEVFFYCLDALLVLLILVIFTFAHFGIWFNRYEREVQAAAKQQPKRTVEMYA